MRHLNAVEIEDSLVAIGSIGFAILQEYLESEAALEDREVEGEMTEIIDLFTQQQSIGAKRKLKNILTNFKSEVQHQKSRQNE